MQRLSLFMAVILFCGVIAYGLFIARTTKQEPPNPLPTLAHKITQQHDEAIIVAAGDVACSSSSPTPDDCQQQATAQVIKKINPDAVLALGDLQYQNGSLDTFQNYYDPTWGGFKAITFPVPGNHEYETPNAAGYFAYFPDKAGVNGKGYYSFDIGQWHLVGLNSNCWAVGGCGESSAQYQWLDQDLRNAKQQCTLVFMHHPRFSSAEHGNNEFMQDIWELFQMRHVDLVLAGHDHVYERFARIDIDGKVTKGGIRSFVVGTGGRNLYAFKTPDVGSEVRYNASFGVLKLTLKPGSYNWEFVPIQGSEFTDKGSDTCR